MCILVMHGHRAMETTEGLVQQNVDVMAGICVNQNCYLRSQYRFVGQKLFLNPATPHTQAVVPNALPDEKVTTIFIKFGLVMISK